MAKLMAVAGVVALMIIGAGCGGDSEDASFSTTTTSVTRMPDSYCIAAARTFVDSNGTGKVDEMINRCESLEEMELALGLAFSSPRQTGPALTGASLYELVMEVSKIVARGCATGAYEGTVCDE
jgi:hypothetical protein